MLPASLPAASVMLLRPGFQVWPFMPVNLSKYPALGMTINISGVSVTSPDGTTKSLGDYAGKVLLIVNVASKCGFTKQYAGLQALNEAYASKGLAVLGFPCNDFGGQEPGSLDEIKSFCSTTYGADFELFDKVNAKGSTTEPYTTLNKTEPAGDVAWNFEKFLVGKDGTVIARYKSDATPEALKAPIEAALAA
jgi:glutathione peroxidase